MGMVLEYHRVSPRDAELLLNQPHLIHRFISDEDEGECEFEAPRPSRGFWSRLLGRRQPEVVRKNLEKTQSPFGPRSDADRADADKAWQGIHYLLTGTEWGGSFPLNFIVGGGSKIGDELVGYDDHPRIFSPSEVAEIDAALAGFSEEVFRARYDGKAMDKAKIYPNIWGRTHEDNFAYAWDYFKEMREFIHSTKDRGYWLLLYVS